jgi:hypothetical protein
VCADFCSSPVRVQRRRIVVIPFGYCCCFPAIRSVFISQFVRKLEWFGLPSYALAICYVSKIRLQHLTYGQRLDLKEGKMRHLAWQAKVKQGNNSKEK